MKEDVKGTSRLGGVVAMKVRGSGGVRDREQQWEQQ